MDIKLDEQRNIIDDIDKELIKLFEQRMDAVGKIAEYKLNNNMKIFDAQREEKVVEKALSRLENGNYSKEAEDFFRSMMTVSKAYQSIIIKKNNSSYSPSNGLIGYFGEEGSYTEQATIEYFGEEVEKVNIKKFDEILEKVSDGSISYGVLPIENSFLGGISVVVDLIREYGLFITGEKIIRVQHNLIGLNDATIDDIKEVYSIPQALEQCSSFFDRREQITLKPYLNTASSVRLVKEKNDKTIAAVASFRAAKIFGLKIIKDDICNSRHNYTRFVVVSRENEINDSCNKLSILLTIPHTPGSLSNILNLFSEKNLNLLKIESRPIPNRPWEYFFYLDFEGNINNPDIFELLNKIEKLCPYYRFLGNYKGDNI